MSTPMRVKFNGITWLGHAIKWMMFTTSCLFTFLYFMDAFNVNADWHWLVQFTAPLFFAIFGLCVADVGLFYWFNVWIGEVETPMQKTVAGVMTALTGLVAVSTTILGILNSLTTLVDITATVKLVVTVVTTVLIVIQLVAAYGMSYFSRDSYVKSAITEAFLQTFEKDIDATAKEALRLRVVNPVQPALPAPARNQASEQELPQTRAAQFPRPSVEPTRPATQARPTVQASAGGNGKQTADDAFAQMLRQMGVTAEQGQMPQTVRRTTQTAQEAPASTQFPSFGDASPVREDKIKVRVNGVANPFTDIVAATAFAHAQSRAGKRAEIFKNGELVNTFEANLPPN